MTLKWGICCCGLISNDFTSAIFEFKSDRNKVVAVAARNIEKAKLFAEKFNVDHYFGSYEKLALFEETDIIYIGSIHPEHCMLTKLFLNHGKHVLVEKPMGLNVSETKEMIELARKKKLFLMEGVWSKFFPIYEKIHDGTFNDTVGTIRHVTADFQQNIKSERIKLKSLGGGGLLDIGIYVLQFALWVFHDKKLEKVSRSIIRIEDDVDICGTILMEFEDNCTAFLSYHAAVNGSTSAAVYGDKGSLVIPHHFWAPEDILINGKENNSFATRRRNFDIKYNFDHSWGFIHEVNHVADCLEKGLLESDIHSLNDTLRLAEIMESILQ